MKQLSNCLPSASILHYFLRSRLEICDFMSPVFVRAKLVFSDCGDARRLLILEEPPFDNAFLWSTSTVEGRSPLAFSYVRRALLRSERFLIWAGVPWYLAYSAA